MTDIELYELTGSPNSVKVRIALAYKGLPYERLPIELVGDFPGDRSQLVEVSGQARTPVLKHGETVMFDSNAILRYLDANFRDTPRLYPDTWQGLGEMEEWELYGKTTLGPAIGGVFAQAMGSLQGAPVDRDVIERSNADFHAATERIEDALSKNAFLTGDELRAADVVLAPPVGLACFSGIDPAEKPIHAFFEQHLELGEGRDKTRAWVEKLLALDPVKP